MLDPKGRKEVMSALMRLKNELGMTIILVTHFMDEAVNADRVVVMNDGVVQFDGTPSEVFSHTEDLKKIGLSVPKPLELALELKKEGYDLGTKILTEDSFLEAFRSLI
jgi:energy-coupling factor transport system ATP-binding protein